MVSFVCLPVFFIGEKADAVAAKTSKAVKDAIGAEAVAAKIPRLSSCERKALKIKDRANDRAKVVKTPEAAKAASASKAFKKVKIEEMSDSPCKAVKSVAVSPGTVTESLVQAVPQTMFECVSKYVYNLQKMCLPQSLNWVLKMFVFSVPFSGLQFVCL